MTRWSSHVPLAFVLHPRLRHDRSPSTRPRWSTRRRARRARGGSRPRGTRRSGRRGRRWWPIARPSRLKQRVPAPPLQGGRCLRDKNVTPDLGSCWRPFPSRPLATTRDIANESGLLVPARPRDRRSGTDEDQRFSCRTGGIGSQDVYTATLVWDRRRPGAA
jgi:hypothetical protein